MTPRLDHKFLHRLAHFKWRRRVRHGPAVIHRHRIRNAARHFPEEPAFLEAEDAAPHAIERHRNDRRLHVLHNPLEPAPERQRVADARDLALGENADDFAVFNGLAGLLQSMNHLARAQLGRNRNRFQNARERFDPRQVVNPFEHDEPDVPVG